MKRFIILMIMAFALKGCFQPLYAELDPTDTSYASTIHVETISGETGQILQTELQFLLKSLRDPQSRSLILTVSPAQSSRSFFEKIERDYARLGAVVMVARYYLVDSGSEQEVTSGIARASATFEGDTQVINREYATRDAEERAAKQAARIIADRIAAKLLHDKEPEVLPES